MNKKLIGIGILVVLIIGAVLIFSNKKKTVNDSNFTISKGETVILEQYKMKVKLSAIKEIDSGKKYIFKVTYNNFTKEFRLDNSTSLTAVLFDEFQMQIISSESDKEINVSISKLFS